MHAAGKGEEKKHAAGAKLTLKDGWQCVAAATAESREQKEREARPPLTVTVTLTLSEWKGRNIERYCLEKLRRTTRRGCASPH